MNTAAVEQSVVERVETGDIEKKKRRRSRRSKHNAAGSAAEEVRGSASESRNSRTRDGSSCVNQLPTEQEQEGLDLHLSDQQGVTRVSNASFSSLPSMHLSEQSETGDLRSSGNQNVLSAGDDREILSKSCPEPRACETLRGIDDDLAMFQQISVSPQNRIFASYWSLEAVKEALEKGQAFKAVFRVNAHNRNEAYCKIEGVPVDILINGTTLQNRAVEGDIVVIKLDPFSLWTKMKGSVTNNSAQPEDSNKLPETNMLSCPSLKGKGHVDLDQESNFGKSESHTDMDAYRDGLLAEKDSSTVVGQGGNGHANQLNDVTLDSSNLGSFAGQSDLSSTVGRLCTIISSFPFKRPTGRVVAIIDTSFRRDTIVGFLNFRQWACHKGGPRADAKKSKALFSISDDEYLQLTPTDPRFPKMIVLVRDLPACIKKRLETGDSTVETELVAAQIIGWGEGNPYPQAQVKHIFGPGGELEPQVNAILYQNSVYHSDFSPESLSCLPYTPWELPDEETQRRKDIRNLCIFTIDPSSATDLDDALSVERFSSGVLRVGVHIADVSHFVLPDTPLDLEAQARSTSVYMSRQKLPMLPPLLSEELGSLNPGVDRLAFSIFWDLNDAGEVIDRWIGRTVIRSCCKLSYDHAQSIINGIGSMGDDDCIENDWPELHGPFEWDDVCGSVKSLQQISKVLRQKRLSNGALQLGSSKLVFLFDESGVPYDSVLSGPKDSNFLVEEFMLLANRTAAEIISRAYPDSALLRRHPEPNLRKLREFESFCTKPGLELDTSSCGHFRQSLAEIKEKFKNDSVFVDIIINYATKPMQLATYFCSGEFKDNVADWGHYGLAVPLYTHFTSPLRRYPDIVVHRTITAAIEAENICLEQLMKKSMEGKRCFTGIHCDKDVAESLEVKEVLAAAAVKHGVPCTKSLAEIAAYCNERKLACRNVADACDKLYTWFLLKKQVILLSEARVLALGPRFMSVYISKLAIERRINYADVEGLSAEWLDATSTLILSRRSFRKGGHSNYRPLKEVAHVINPCDIKHGTMPPSEDESISPGVFPLTIRVLSTIPVVLHAVGGDDGPLDIGVRLYMSSYHK